MATTQVDQLYMQEAKLEMYMFRADCQVHQNHIFLKNVHLQIMQSRLMQEEVWGDNGYHSSRPAIEELSENNFDNNQVVHGDG